MENRSQPLSPPLPLQTLGAGRRRFWHRGHQKYLSSPTHISPPPLPLHPSLRPNYICGVTADGISTLPLWEGTIFLRIFLPPRCSSPNMRTVHLWCWTQLRPKIWFMRRPGGRNNLYDWIPSSPNVFPSSSTWGRHCSKCLFRKIKLWGRNRGSLWGVWSRRRWLSCKN